MHFLIVMGVIVLVRPISSSDFIEFLFHNQEICGNPFADAQWVPVLDTCQMECDLDKELCVEDDLMTQRCNKLPVECIAEWTIKKEKAKTSATAANRESRVRLYAPNEALRPLPESLSEQLQLQGVGLFQTRRNFF